MYFNKWSATSFCTNTEVHCFPLHFPLRPLTEQWGSRAPGPRQSRILRVLTCSRVLAIFAILLFQIPLKVWRTNIAQRQCACCPEILWWNCLIWILTRKPKDSSSDSRGRWITEMVFSPGKRKSNYMCIDFFKGWHWILRNILESYLPSIGKLKRK